MRTITTIGLDIAKSVFQVRGVDAVGQVAIRRQLKRRYVLAFFQKLPSCLVGMEACASSHHWSRELEALGPHMAQSGHSATAVWSPLSGVKRTLRGRVTMSASDPSRQFATFN